jgi:hypothetical protein
MTLSNDLPRCASCGHVLEDGCGCNCCPADAENQPDVLT